MIETQPEEILLSKALDGDARSFATLCDRYRNRVWRIVASVAKGPDVDDLAQEAIVKAFCAIKSYRGEASFEAWLCRIALNAAHDYHRSAWKRRVVFWQRDADVRDIHEEYGESAEATDVTVLRRELQRKVRKAVASLPEHQRSPIWLHFFEGFSIAEVARLESISESTLRSRVQAGLKRLAMSLDDVPGHFLDSPVRLEPESKGCWS